MEKNEYHKISVSRGSFNKKGLLYILVDLVGLSNVSHDEVLHTYSISTQVIAQMSETDINLLAKLTKHFCHYDFIKDKQLHFKYSLV